MNFEPQKFFIGLVDFFSILMPGGLLAYLGKDRIATAILGQPSFQLNSTETWMLFLFVSYLLGHFLFLLGALLDEWVYGPLRHCVYWGQVGRLAKGKRLNARVWRSLAESDLFFGSKADESAMQTERIQARALQPLSAEHAINAFQWSKTRLSKEHPEGLVAVQRFEADSKFFRSFVVVLALLALIYWFQYRRGAALICSGLLLLALWRYMDERFKASQHAYWFVITLETMKKIDSRDLARHERSDGLTHSGGVVFRRSGKTVEYLLVEASKNRTEWVLPKGHIEPGEDPRTTAVREVKEETGQWARVVDWIDDVYFETAPNRPFVRVFLMEWIDDPGLFETLMKMLFKRPSGREKGWRPEARQPKWLPLAEAVVKTTFKDIKTLLKAAEEKIGSNIKL